LIFGISKVWLRRRCVEYPPLAKGDEGGFLRQYSALKKSWGA